MAKPAWGQTPRLPGRAQLGSVTHCRASAAFNNQPRTTNDRSADDRRLTTDDMFVDSHAHLEGHRYDADRDQVVAPARDAGIQTIVAIGNGDGPANFDCGVLLAEKYDFIYATIGIHPHEAKLADQSAYDRMAQIAKRPKVIAWGEIGLDYYYDHSPRDLQRQVFATQMELARAANLPIVIHCRPSNNSEDAWNDCLRMISEQWASS